MGILICLWIFKTTYSLDSQERVNGIDPESPDDFKYRTNGSGENDQATAFLVEKKSLAFRDSPWLRVTLTLPSYLPPDSRPPVISGTLSLLSAPLPPLFPVKRMTTAWSGFRLRKRRFRRDEVSPKFHQTANYAIHNDFFTEPPAPPTKRSGLACSLIFEVCAGPAPAIANFLTHCDKGLPAWISPPFSGSPPPSA
jgi:hypothetical protein